IALLEIDGTMTIVRSPRTQGKALGFSAEEDWKDSQDLLVKFAGMKDPKPDVKGFFTNEFLSDAPYLPKK
ncbi:MAG: hypothetical protein L0Y55_07280, partial [Anaerolineales bacterium]|nr:hypothetical protein [Anaerolineales bacterium]